MMVTLGKLLGSIGIARALIRRCWAYENKRLVKKLDGISFPNPIGLSAGFDYDADLVATIPAVGFGFHTVGTITLQSYEGNAGPKLGRFPKSRALLVNKGLKNSGAREIIKKLKLQTGSGICCDG